MGSVNGIESRTMYKILTRLKILMLLFTLTSPAYSTDDPSTTCNRAGIQQKVDACAARDYRAADAALNIKYGDMMNRLSVTERAALRSHQRDWLRKRDLQCKPKASLSGGESIGMVAYFSCMQESTEKRTAELNRF